MIRDASNNQDISKNHDTPLADLRKAAEPLMRYLNDYPQAIVIITPTSVELYEGVLGHSRMYDLFKDNNQ